MADRPLRLLLLGAHPDDAEYHAGGLASAYRRGGHTGKTVSPSAGSAGHPEKTHEQLAGIQRQEEAAAAAGMASA